MEPSTSRSNLLNSRLSGDIVCQKILPFLERSSCKNVMAVKPLSDRFHLTGCFCHTHGTKLEAKADISGCGGGDLHINERKRKPLTTTAIVSEETMKDGGSQGTAIDSMEPPSKRRKCTTDKDKVVVPQEDINKKLHCEDCLHAQQGRQRCQGCDHFQANDNFVVCAQCEGSECTGCFFEGLDFFFCSTCEKSFCGKGACPQAWGCDICYTIECSECKPKVACFDCGKDDWHLECGVSHGRISSCSRCENVYCSDCSKDKSYCQQCEQAF